MWVISSSSSSSLSFFLSFFFFLNTNYVIQIDEQIFELTERCVLLFNEHDSERLEKNVDLFNRHSSLMCLSSERLTGDEHCVLLSLPTNIQVSKVFSGKGQRRLSHLRKNAIEFIYSYSCRNTRERDAFGRNHCFLTIDDDIDHHRVDRRRSTAKQCKRCEVRHRKIYLLKTNE